MLYWSLFLLLFVYLFNTFGIAKLYKRYFKNIDIVWCLTFGFLSCLWAFNFPIILLTLFNATISFLNYYLLVIQIVLLILYIYNWKWFFITWKIDWKKVLCALGVLIAILLGWIFTNKLVGFSHLTFTSDTKMIDNFLYQAAINPDGVRVSTNQINLIPRALFYNIFASYFSIINLTKEEMGWFINIFSLVTYICFLTLVIMTVFYSRNLNVISKVLLLPTFSFIVSFLNMSLSSNIFDFGQFITPLIFLMIWIHYTRYYEISSTLSIIVINLISSMALTFNMSFLLLFTMIGLITLGISYYTKKQRATDYNFFNLFIIIITWSLMFEKVEYLAIVLFVIVICIYIFYIFYRTSKLGMRINEAIDQFFYKWIVAFMAFFVIVILLTIAIYYANNNYDVTIFNIWQLEYFFGTDMHNDAIYWSVNVSFWCMNIFIFVYAIITIWVKRKKIGEFNYMELSFLSMVLFWNPLSLDLIQKFFDLGIFNLQANKISYLNMFLIPAVPLFISMTKNSINHETKNIYNISYISIISLVTLVSMVLLNLY